MHDHGSARAERVHSKVFCCKSKSDYPNHNGLVPEDCDDIRGTDRAEPVSGVKLVANGGGSRAPLFYVGAH